MIKRRLLYGYEIQNGEQKICVREADTVKRIFQLYLSEMSYREIADMLNCEHVLYSIESPRWDKHKIKRMLENPRYIGSPRYPEIIRKEQFDAVQEVIRHKTISRASRKENAIAQLKGYLCCADCGIHLIRIGNHTNQRDAICFKCPKCGTRFTISEFKLLNMVMKQTTESTAKDEYTPSAEVFRLENEINRALEQPNEPQQTIDMILRSISVRYDCCADGSARQKNRPCEMDWKHFRQTVSHVIITSENQVQVIFK